MESKNFQAGIHRVNYRDNFFEKMIEDSYVASFSRQIVSLDGLWQYGIDQYDNCLRNNWHEEHTKDLEGRPLPLDYSFDTWELIPVPSCWNLHNEKLFHYEGSIVYTRLFEFTKTNERVFLNFGGANYRTFIFLNKKFLGAHEGGHTPFSLEITEHIKDKNRIICVVDNTRCADGVPTENTDWFNYGGLHRSVTIFCVPKVFIRRFNTALVPNSNFNKIFVSAEIDGAINGEAIFEIAELGICALIPVSNGKSYIELPVKPDLWSPDNPKLYNVSLRFCEDSLTDQVGYRDIRVSGTDILLNGHKIFLKGCSTHEESAQNGKSITEDEIKNVFSLAQEMGCNFLRLAHYPHSETAARIADRMGILLWEEIPVYWSIDFLNEKTLKNADNQLRTLIKRDYNRASVIIWSVGNENADTDDRLAFMSLLADTAKELDSTRLVSAACLVDNEKLLINDRLTDKLDVIGINEYYGWYDPDFSKLPILFENSKPNKPVIITEFGADAAANYFGDANTMFTEQFQERVYDKQIKAISGISYIKGMTPWILYDFRCPRRLHSMQKYYNIKGLLSADLKHKKLAFHRLSRFYRDLRFSNQDA